MEANVVDCELAERELCVCKGGASLEILKEVQRAYEERLQVIERVGGKKKLQMQVDALHAWVGDLVGQNSLLVRTVEELESEATARLLVERTRHAEITSNIPCNSNLKELMSVNDSLQKENVAKEREIRRLNKDVQQYERAIVSLRSNPSIGSCHLEVSKKDAECMAGMSCNRAECGAMELVNYGTLLKDDSVKYQERIRKMEINLKSSSESVRALRKINVTLSEELHALRRVCAALDEQCRAATQRAQFKDDIIREMRRQLKQAKAKLKESEMCSMKSQNDYSGDLKLHSESASFGSASICVRRQPRRSRPEPRAEPPLHPDSDDCRTPRFGGSGDDGSVRAD